MLFASDDASGAELVRAIEDDPYDSNALAIYADWLTARGDIRGDLVNLQIAAERDASKRVHVDELLREHADALLGPLWPFHERDPSAFVWRYGFIHRARFDIEPGDGIEALTRHPSGRFVVEVTTGLEPGGDRSYQDFVDCLVERAPPTLHVLNLCVTSDPRVDRWRHGTDLERVWAAVPRLRRLVVEGGWQRYGSPDLPNLEHVELRTGGLRRTNLATLARARLPAVRFLELSGDHDRSERRQQVRHGRYTVSECQSTIADLRGFLDDAQLPAIRHLGITQCLYTNNLINALADWRYLGQLESLDLSRGYLSDAGAARLESQRSAFRHLAVLDVSGNYLSEGAVRRLQRLFHRVVADDQRPPLPVQG